MLHLKICVVVKHYIENVFLLLKREKIHEKID